MFIVYSCEELMTKEKKMTICYEKKFLHYEKDFLLVEIIEIGISGKAERKFRWSEL